jgi:hypothetical protein
MKDALTFLERKVSPKNFNRELTAGLIKTYIARAASTKP